MAVSYADGKIEVEGLVERFARGLDVYKRTDYKEAHVRVEFIDPFFEALGWDVRNVQGYAEQYKDVIHEDAIKVGGATRAPDYCFRIGGARKFFLEAKKPSVSVRGDVGPAYQLRRYAWSATLPLSILTDFEEFSVYDCRQRPKPTDKASAGRVMYLTFDQYLDRFDDVYGVFAKESVLKGSFDRYVQDAKRKRGTSEVDIEFLKEIEGWREVLARNIALRNRALSVHELNFAVQRTIDRIIFLRMCEDRGIEDYARLLALTSGPYIYPRLGDLYRQADEKYNAGLFDFRVDTLTKTLAIDDKVLRPILAGLYYPQSPYEFSVLPAEILGQVYEQFLGKVIRLTPGHRAKVEEKPEVKKAGGVYYTPTYIVDYIVKQTVGRLVEGKTPRQISKLRILDPACGSGSFLLGAYQYLLDYHRQWYEAHDPVKHARGKRPALYQGPRGGWRLTTAEKKRILLNNIYGVDIDRQAVEVTKLSLLLKVLEGESQETLGQQLALWRERALPDLGNNIKCGNSLIGPDYFEAQLLPDEEEVRRVNPFDWEAEFPEIIADGGFNCVIGNPPYNAALTDEERTHLKQKFEGVKAGRQDSAAIFVETGLRLSRGLVMYLLPYRLISRRRNHGPFQKWLYHNSHIQQVIYIGKIKEIGANDEFMMMRLENAKDMRGLTMFVAPHASRDNIENFTIEFDELKQDRWGPPNYEMNVRLGRFNQNVLAKTESVSIRLGEIATSRDGIVPFIRDKLVSNHKKDERYKPLLGIRGFYSLSRYSSSWGGTYICYDIEEARKYIKDKKELRKVQLRDESIFLQPEKVLTAQDSKTIKGTLDTESFYTTNSIHTTYMKAGIEGYNIRYILGLMNSRLVNYYHQSLVLKGQDLHPQILVTNLRKLPIRAINFDDPADVARHNKMVTLVERMLALHKKLAAATIPADKQLYQRQIEATDRQIDALVYELYGLTEEEIGVVEGRN